MRGGGINASCDRQVSHNARGGNRQLQQKITYVAMLMRLVGITQSAPDGVCGGVRYATCHVACHRGQLGVGAAAGVTEACRCHLQAPKDSAFQGKRSSCSLVARTAQLFCWAKGRAKPQTTTCAAEPITELVLLYDSNRLLLLGRGTVTAAGGSPAELLLVPPGLL